MLDLVWFGYFYVTNRWKLLVGLISNQDHGYPLFIQLNFIYKWYNKLATKVCITRYTSMEIYIKNRHLEEHKAR